MECDLVKKSAICKEEETRQSNGAMLA